MNGSYDVIVVGLGAMGSAAAYHLTRNGKRVLGLDRFRPPHQFGSSHGLTRIIREAYFEHPSYVPLVQRAYDLWSDLEKQSGRKLLVPTGGLMIGPPEGALVKGARRSAEQHHLRHELFSAAELTRRFDIFQPEEQMAAVWEPRAGVLFPELVIQSHLELAAGQGASLRFDEPVAGWEPDGKGVRVFSAGNVYQAEKLLLTAGSGMASLTPDLKLPLTVERQVLFWFEPRARADRFRPESCPIHIWEYTADRFFYGFPDLGGGVKVAVHHRGESTDPERVRREVGEEEVESMRRLLRRFLPDAEGRLHSALVCTYTNTPDLHFILDHHPDHPQVFVASPCSGHGFKFSSAIGELASTLLSGERSPFDLSLFGLGRFARTETQ